MTNERKTCSYLNRDCLPHFLLEYAPPGVVPVHPRTICMPNGNHSSIHQGSPLLIRLQSIQLHSSVVTPRLPEPSPSNRLASPATPPSHGTLPATTPTLNVACTFTLTATTPTAAPALAPTVSFLKRSPLACRHGRPSRRQTIFESSAEAL